MTTAPNQLWSWGITKHPGPTRGTCYQLYVITDAFSRYIPGWLLAGRRSANLVKRPVRETLRKQMIKPGQLTLHADRVGSIESKPLALLLSDLGVTKTHSRPRVKHDNPHSESQFKTLKYRPDFRDRFGSPTIAYGDARAWVGSFFDWYNQEYYHSSLGLLTPASVHDGLATEQLELRQSVLDDAFSAHLERFVRKPPSVQPLPEAVWINRPQTVFEVGQKPQAGV